MKTNIQQIKPTRKTLHQPGKNTEENLRNRSRVLVDPELSRRTAFRGVEKIWRGNEEDEEVCIIVYEEDKARHGRRTRGGDRKGAGEEGTGG